MKISVVFLLYNGISDYFEETLNMLYKQKHDFDLEIIAIDSGSTDGTVDFVKNHKDVFLHQISNKEFGHGKTRQMGINLAKGEYVIFLTQDATPANEYWLSELVKKITSDDKIIAVASRVLPRNNALAIRKYNVLSEWCAGNEDFEVFGVDNENYKIHDISAIYRKSFMIESGFDDVDFGEDVLIAKKILEKGFKTAFGAKSIVRHSHNYDIKSTYKRNLIDGKFNRRHLNKDTVTSIKNIVLVTVKLFTLDFKNIIKDKKLSLFKKIKNIIYSPIIHLFEALGQYKGNKKI